jgi:hypothetical protein
VRFAAPDPDGLRGLVNQDLRLAEWARDPEVEAKDGFPIPHEGGDVAPNILRARRQLLIVRGAANVAGLQLLVDRLEDTQESHPLGLDGFRKCLSSATR